MSVLDKPRKTLDPVIWDLNQHTPKLYNHVRNIILESLFDWLKEQDYWEKPKEIFFVGSSATLQYGPQSDIDITVVLPSDIETSKELRKLANQTLSGKNLIESHPINYFFRSDEIPLESADAIYDVMDDMWIKQSVSEGTVDKGVLDKALEWAKHIDLEKGELLRDIVDYRELLDLLDEVHQEEREDLFEAVKKMAEEVEGDIASLTEDYENIKDDRLRAFEEDIKERGLEAGKEYLSRNWLPENIIYKFLEKYRYLKLLRDLKNLYYSDLSEEEKIEQAETLVATKKNLPTKWQQMGKTNPIDITNVVYELEEEPHIGDEDADSPKPSKRWKEQVKERERLDLQRKPTNESAGVAPGRFKIKENDIKIARKVLIELNISNEDSKSVDRILNSYVKSLSEREYKKFANDISPMINEGNVHNTLVYLKNNTDFENWLLKRKEAKQKNPGEVLGDVNLGHLENKKVYGRKRCPICKIKTRSNYCNNCGWNRMTASEEEQISPEATTRYVGDWAARK